MALDEAFAAHEAKDRAAILADTWGHLGPKPRTDYHGWMVWAHSAYGGDILLVDAALDGLPDSPWLHEDMVEYIGEHMGEPGNVYRWEGTYTKFKNGQCRFSGQVSRVVTR